MIYQSGLIKKDLSVLKKKSWYNQRFDGCLNLMWMISELEIKAEKRKMPGGNDRLHLGIFADHKVDWYIDLADAKRVANMFLHRAKKENSIGQKLLQKWQTDEIAFDQLVAKFSSDNFSLLSNRDLRLLYKKLTMVYIKALSSSSLIDDFALGTDEIVQQEINKLLDQRQIYQGRGNIFSVLTAPVHQSFINQAELSLLNIALLIGPLKLLVTKLKQPVVKKLVTRHQQQYFWIKNNYHDSYILSERHFIKEIQSLLKSRIDIKREIDRIKNTPAVNRAQKRKLFKKLQPNRYLLSLLEISEKFSYWQDERKKRTLLFTHCASLLLKEIGRRFGQSLAAMCYLTHDEVNELLAGKVFPPTELLARSKKTFIYQKGNHYEIFSGARAALAVKQIFKDADHSSIQDFRGLTAATGKVRGRAKIVKSVKEINKVKPGDILVAVMTRPDYIIGLKKAAAIVTDEGGVTCHAAIIARELGIPCIIGTKIGTKVLHDGDLIEVNANHGWVRKVK